MTDGKSCLTSTITSASLIIITIMAAAWTDAASEKAAGTARIHVAGLRSDSGQVVCTLFSSPQGYPGDDNSQNTRTTTAKIIGRTAVCNFPGLAAGTYAAVVFHDENSDRSFNRNWIGMPKEGYGFSNNVFPMFRAPTFEEAGFRCSGGTINLKVRIRY